MDISDNLCIFVLSNESNESFINLNKLVMYYFMITIGCVASMVMAIIIIEAMDIKNN